MANWDGPFHLPKMTTDEFTRMKAEYVAKYGYAVSVPGFEDIIHWKTFKPLTQDEEYLWKNRRYEEFAPKRLDEIRTEKNRKREKLLAMLASPSPRIAMNVASIMTALDDAQDAVSTMAAIAIIAAKILPVALRRAITGPLGWLMAASDLMNLLNPYSHVRKKWGVNKSGFAEKKKLEKLTDKNPFSKKARARIAGWTPDMPPPKGMTIPPGVTFPKDWMPGDKFPKGVKIAKGTKIPWGRIKKFKPHKGTLLEGLQTTDEVFGIGISLGPIMGLAQDVLAGMVRDKMGQKVDIKFPPGARTSWEKAAERSLKSNIVFQAFEWESDMMDEIFSMLSLNLSLQAAYPLLQEWNPLEEVENIGELYIKAPVPEDILTIEVIEEAGYNVEDLCGWPGPNTLWASLDEISTISDDYATRNIRHFGEKYRHSIEAFIGAQNANDFAVNMIAALEGPEQVEVDYIRESRIMMIILNNGFIFPDDITLEQVEKFQDWCYTHEYLETMPDVRDIQRYAEVFCDFTWIRSPIEWKE